MLIPDTRILQPKHIYSETYTTSRLRIVWYVPSISTLLISGDPVGKQIVAASRPAELAESVPFISLALPENTLTTYEVDHTFSDILVVSDHEAQIPVVVKLGPVALQMVSVSCNARESLTR